MKVAVVAPSPVPFTMGGTERAVTGIARAINEHTVHDAELLKLPVREHTLHGLVAGYRAFAELDVRDFDLVISTKYPAWMIEHPNHTCYLFHPLRGLYDTYRPPVTAPAPASPAAAALADAARRTRTRAAAHELLDRFDATLRELGPDHPDLALVSPTGRELVHALDRVARGPDGVHRHLALSRTIAARPGYFPTGVRPEVCYLPPDIRCDGPGGSEHFFTMSRFDRPKRLHLVVEAMRRATTDRPLLLAGTGPEERELRRLAAGDARIRFLGRVDDAEAAGRYRYAIAVPFVPEDEDYGLITVEAMACGAPVVTTRDAGGPAELVTDGATGLVVAPEPAALATALDRLAGDRQLARRLGDQARHSVEELTWARTAETLTAAGTVATRPGGGPSTRVPAEWRRGKPLVVALSTYAVFPAQHGGQLRCAALFGGLAEAFDVQLMCLGPFDTGESDTLVGPGIRQLVLPMTRAQAERCWTQEPVVGVPLNDVLGGASITENRRYVDELRTALRDASAVILAHPYLQPALAALDNQVPVAFDAHNVERDLKAALYPSSALGRGLLRRVEEVERASAATAELVTACAEADAARLSTTTGRPVRDIHVVPNGASVPDEIPAASVRQGATRRWLRSFGGTAPHHRGIATFLASFHGPNVDAARCICDVAGDAPEVLFVLGGGHGDALRRTRLPANVVITGMLSTRAKDALLDASSVALNPMLKGSGTNLKVLEYLARGVPVVSSAFGVRGLGLVDGDHLLLAEPTDLVAAIRRIIDDPDGAHRRALAGHALVAERFSWDELARRYRELLAPLVAQSAGQNRRAYSAES